MIFETDIRLWRLISIVDLFQHSGSADDFFHKSIRRSPEIADVSRLLFQCYKSLEAAENISHGWSTTLS
ncbi:hypothetical protein DPMN_165816 [Dreissena polymorpha]|uniref:Uncharacterized protein n=1 Tax=Dreissena polymorpha TaxID=45954 RepID=A0A9D4EVM8_DREPO|nr:hypothetical protein DPMN_165816 [Dreissena polymorpha]